MCEAPITDETSVTRSAEYVGSFPVDDQCLDEQIEDLHVQLKVLRSCRRRRAVSLKFSVKGVKMYNEDETTLLMAHALRRVSLSTARPAAAQFAFVAHNPGRDDAQLYCHMFKARHARAAQFLNLLLCRCFQLSYLEKNPEEAQVEGGGGQGGALPRRKPSLLNHGFPLSVSALVSFRRAPFQGLLPGTKKSPKLSKKKKKKEDELSSPQSDVDLLSPCCSPSLVRQKAMRTKALCSGAYRSFTFTPLKQRLVQDHLSAATAGKVSERSPVRRCRAPSLVETEEALAQAVWCWAGIATDSSMSLLSEDVLGSYLMCPHPKKAKHGSLIIRCPSGLVTHLIHCNRAGNITLQKCGAEFMSLSELLEFYTERKEQLACSLSAARVNHCYEWEEHTNKDTPPKAHSSFFSRNKNKSSSRKWF